MTRSQSSIKKDQATDENYEDDKPYVRPKDAILQKHITWQEKKDAWSKMCTEIRIPYERAPKDPAWMIKKRIGERLNATEV
jgi:hypothetical protein